VNACGEECAHGDLLRDHDYLTLYPGNDGFQTTAPARSFGLGKTPDGIYDLAGNVLEWTSSSYCKYGEPDCASPWKVARGGAWDSDVRDGVKAARRSKNARDAKAPDLGFRCAL
jgi:iron(II)-dependent oxidoreductase